jgi:hypothetical protein
MLVQVESQIVTLTPSCNPAGRPHFIWMVLLGLLPCPGAQVCCGTPSSSPGAAFADAVTSEAASATTITTIKKRQ